MVRRFFQEILAMFSAFQAGGYSRRIHVSSISRLLRQKAKQLNDIARLVEDEIGELSQERDVLHHILQSMTTGVVYIGQNGNVQMVNAAAQRMFRRPLEQWMNRQHWTIFQNHTIGDAVDNALLFAAEWVGELMLRENMTLSLRIIPIVPSTRGSYRGEASYDVLLLSNDVSEYRRLETMRSEFVANVSHELKTPIAAIRGFSETLLDEDVEPQLRQRFLQTIYDESNRMGALVSDLLELSKLEAEEHRMNFTRLRLDEVTHRAFDRLHNVSETRNVSLRLVSEGQLTVWADENMLLQVFLNLLGNALTYSPPGSEVIVSYEELVDRVKVHVQDNGMGIPEEHLARVFERFYRVHRDRSRASGGTGLGLAIVKHIVSVLGGEVGVSSQVEQGSDFWFILSRLNPTQVDEER